MMGRVPDATYQVWWKSVHKFWKRRFLKGFYHIWAWLPSWSCDPNSANKFWFPLSIGGFTQNLALIGQAISEKKRFEIVEDGGTDEGYAVAWVYHKFTYEPLLGLGDLTKGSL